MNIVALIPLRAGSVSIPNKNIKALCGKPLFFWVVDAAFKADNIDEIYISTDSQEIAKIAKYYFPKVKIIDRPLILATNTASTESVMLHFMSMVNFDILMTIQATSPLITSFDIDSAIVNFLENNFDSMLTAVRCKRFFWSDNSTPLNYDPANRPLRQDFVGTLMENGAFYLTKRSILLAHSCRLGGKIGIHEMSELSSIEIDEPDDWDRVEEIFQNQLSTNNNVILKSES
jgi:CMP-N-acetylneuraminic acid synthetase